MEYFCCIYSKLFSDFCVLFLFSLVNMIFKVVHVILLASVKYFVTLPYAMIIGLDYEQALLAVLVGGIGGFLFFYYLSKQLTKGMSYFWPFICQMVPSFIKNRYQTFCARKMLSKPAKRFSRKNRFIAKLRYTYGFWGIIIATPIILTIPVGAFLANKYYSKRRQTVPYMILSIIGWAAVLSGIVHIFPRVFF